MFPPSVAVESLACSLWAVASSIPIILKVLKLDHALRWSLLRTHQLKVSLLPPTVVIASLKQNSRYKYLCGPYCTAISHLEASALR
jgi:hypothetical protein